MLVCCHITVVTCTLRCFWNQLIHIHCSYTQTETLLSKKHYSSVPPEKCGPWSRFRLAGGGVLTTHNRALLLPVEAWPWTQNNPLGTVGAPYISLFLSNAFLLHSCGSLGLALLLSPPSSWWHDEHRQGRIVNDSDDSWWINKKKGGLPHTITAFTHIKNGRVLTFLNRKL